MQTAKIIFVVALIVLLIIIVFEWYASSEIKQAALEQYYMINGGR